VLPDYDEVSSSCSSVCQTDPVDDNFSALIARVAHDKFQNVGLRKSRVPKTTSVSDRTIGVHSFISRHLSVGTFFHPPSPRPSSRNRPSSVALSQQSPHRSEQPNLAESSFVPFPQVAKFRGLGMIAF